MIFVEHLPGVADIEILVCGLLPGQRRQPIEVSLDDPVLGGLRRHALQSGELAQRLFLRFFRHTGLFDLLAVFLDLTPSLVAFAQLIANGFHLLSQIVLALRLLNLFLGLLLDLLTDLAHLQLVEQHLAQELHLVRKSIHLQQLLGVVHLDPQIGGQKVDEQPAIIQLLDEADGLIGELRDELRQLHRHLGEIPMQRLFENRFFHSIRREVHPGLQVGIFLRPLPNVEALQALNEDGQRAILPAHHTMNDRHRARRMNFVGTGDLHRGILHRQQANETIPFFHLLDQTDRAGNAHSEGHDDKRKRDRIAQGENGDLLRHFTEHTIKILILHIEPG